MIDKTERKLETAYRRAFRKERDAINALPPTGGTRKQFDRCWALAAETNAAMKALSDYRETLATRAIGAEQGTPC